MKLCECGCGAEVKQRFVSGHNFRVQINAAFLPGVSEKKSRAQKKTIALKKQNNPEKYEEWQMNVRKAEKKIYGNPVIFQLFSDRMRARRQTQSFLEASRNANPKRSSTVQAQWDCMTEQERITRVQAIMRGASIHPNSRETELNEILKEFFPNEFIMNVDKYRVIAGKIPDFISDSNLLLVELFGDYWHSKELTGNTKEQEEQERIAAFSATDYSVVIIWESELQSKEAIRNKILEAMLCRV